MEILIAEIKAELRILEMICFAVGELVSSDHVHVTDCVTDLQRSIRRLKQCIRDGEETLNEVSGSFV